MEEERTTDGHDSSHRQQQHQQQQRQQKLQHQHRQAAAAGTAPPTRSQFLGCFALSRTKSSKAAAVLREDDGLPEQLRKRKRSQQEEGQQQHPAPAAQTKRQKLVRCESIVSISSSVSVRCCLCRSCCELTCIGLIYTQESSSFDPTALLAEHEEAPQQRITGAEDDWLFTSFSKHATSASHSPTRRASDCDATRPTSRRTAAPAATPELEEAPLSEAEKRERLRRAGLAHGHDHVAVAAVPSSAAAPARRVPTVATTTSPPPPRDREHEQHEEASDAQQKLARHSSSSSGSSRSWKITDAATSALPPFCPPSFAGHRVAPPVAVDQEGQSAIADTQQQQHIPDSAESTKTAFFSSHAPSSQGSLASSRSWLQLAPPLDPATAKPTAVAPASAPSSLVQAQVTDVSTRTSQSSSGDCVEDSQRAGAPSSAAPGRATPEVTAKEETAQPATAISRSVDLAASQGRLRASHAAGGTTSTSAASVDDLPRSASTSDNDAAGSPELRSTSPEVVVPNRSARQPARPPRLAATIDTDEETASDNALRPDFGKKRQSLARRKPRDAPSGSRRDSQGSASGTETQTRKHGRRKLKLQLPAESDTQTDGSRASSASGRLAMALAKPFARNPNPTREEKIALAARTGLTTSKSGHDASVSLINPLIPSFLQNKSAITTARSGAVLVFRHFSALANTVHQRRSKRSAQPRPSRIAHPPVAAVAAAVAKARLSTLISSKKQIRPMMRGTRTLRRGASRRSSSGRKRSYSHSFPRRL